MRDGNRVRIYHIDKETAEGAYVKYFYLALLRKCPADARIISVFQTYTGGYSVRIESNAFANVEPGYLPPTFDFTVTEDDMKNEMSLELAASAPTPATVDYSDSEENNTTSLVDCICDFAYTGLTAHRRDCPVKARIK